jgi:hypothetical protein
VTLKDWLLAVKPSKTLRKWLERTIAKHASHPGSKITGDKVAAFA